MKFLITGANGDIAISLLKILKRIFKKSEIYGTDINPNGIGKLFYKKMINIVPANNEDFLTKSQNIYKKFNLVIPTTEAEIKKISKNLKCYKKNNVLINNQFVINTFLDKIKTFEYLKINKINNLKFCERIENHHKFKPPFFCKTRFGSGNKDYKILNNHFEVKQMIKIIDKKSNYIIQEYIKCKKEYTCCIYKDEFTTKLIIFDRILNKDKTDYARVYRNTKIEKILIKFAKNLNFKGSINVQFKIRNNKLKIFEINPRLSSTVLMRHLIGFKDFEWWIKNKLKIRYSTNRSKIKTNIKILREDKISILK